MVSRLIRMRWPIPVAVLVVLVGVVAVAVLANRDDGPTLVVYNGRSHYGQRSRCSRTSKRRPASRSSCGAAPVQSCSSASSKRVGHPRGRARDDRHGQPWRADDAGLLAPVNTPTLEANVPEGLHDPDGAWWAISTRIRVPVISTERVDLDTVDLLHVARRSAVPRPHLPADLVERVQPVARRRHDRQARHGRHPTPCSRRGWTTTPTSSRRTASCSVRSPTGTATSASPTTTTWDERCSMTPTSRWLPPGPTRMAPEPTPTCRASAW